MAMFDWRILKTSVDEVQNFQRITDEKIIYRYDTICNHQSVIKNRKKIDNIYQDKYLKVLITNFYHRIKHQKFFGVHTLHCKIQKHALRPLIFVFSFDILIFINM